MAGSHHGMTDEALDRELAELFAVDPSPSFVARIRERVADERIEEPWWRLTWVPATLAALALASMLFVGFGPEPATERTAQVPPAPAGASTTPAPHRPEAIAMPGGAVARVSQARGTLRRAKRTPALVVDPFDDIQLSSAEQEVLKGLRASWHGVPLPDITPVPRDAEERPVSVSAITVADVMVARVVIEPTALMARREE
jgi:hypothetical protein